MLGGGADAWLAVCDDRGMRMHVFALEVTATSELLSLARPFPFLPYPSSSSSSTLASLAFLEDLCVCALNDAACSSIVIASIGKPPRFARFTRFAPFLTHRV